MMDKQTISNQLCAILLDLRQKENYEEMIEHLTGTIKINSLVNYYIHAADEYDSVDRVNIEVIIQILQEIYNNSDIISPISDENYDKLYAVNLQVNNQDIVGSTVGNARDKVISAHKYPGLRGTLDKIHFITNDEKKPNEKRKSLEDWVKSTLNRMTVRPTGRIIVELFPKWDGISGIFECQLDGEVEKVLKRGDTTLNEAEEMTPMFAGTNMEEYYPWKDEAPFGLKTEIVMTRANYERLCEKYGTFKSPRSAVSSIINSKDFDRKFLEFLTVIPLQVQNYETKEIVTAMAAYSQYPYATAELTDYETIKEKIKRVAGDVKDELGIDIDGVVIRIASMALQEDLGREDNINKYEVAYKLPPEQKKTILTDVEMSVGVLGAVTPVAKIEPVKLKGNTISSISLGSIDRFESLALNKGDEVIIKYDVIPYLDIDETCAKGTGEAYVTPTECPFCNETLVKQPVLKCINNNCESRMIGKILNYVTKMSIPNISIGTITALFKEGVLGNITDLYNLSDYKQAIVQMSGFGPVSYQNIIDGIESRTEVFDYELLGSLGIPDIGRKMFKKILEVYDIDELIVIAINNDKKKLTKIAGIKDKTAEKIILGIISNAGIIEFLRLRLNVKHDNRKYTIKVLFTKVRDEEFEKYLDTKDVLVMDGYSKAVDMVIVPDYATESSKVDKARKAGKEIVSIEDAYKMFQYK